MEEIWKDVVGYEGLYQVSNLGRVKSLHHNKQKILKQTIIHGYYRVTLTKNKEHKIASVHRLVAIAFIPNPNNKPHVGHKDENNFLTGNGCNNCVDNLEWVSPKENNNMPLKRNKMSQENNPFYGKCHSMATKQHLSEIHKGRKLTETHKQHIKEALKNKKHPRSKPVICDNKIFINIKQCAEYYDVVYSTMKSWLNGSNPMPLKWQNQGLRYYCIDNE